MSILSPYALKLVLHPPPPPSSTCDISYPSHLSFTSLIDRPTSKKRRPKTSSAFVVSSTHSNPKILKPNKKTRFGKVLSFYDSDDEEEEEDEEDDDDDDDDVGENDWLLDDDFAETKEYKVNGKRLKSSKRGDFRKGSRKQIEKARIISMPKHEPDNSFDDDEEDDDTGSGKNALDRRKEARSWNINGRGQPLARQSVENRYSRLAEEVHLDSKWLPLLDYLSTFGLKESHFLQMYERHMPSLQINVTSAKERLEYLISVGVKQRDVKRILVRQPQILQYTVEKNLKSHVSFLMGLGIPSSKIGQIVAATPSLFSYSLENSLKPTVRYLIEEVGIKENDLGKVIQLSPQILVQRIDISWNTRYMFLSKELGAPRDSVVKMVKKHPQLLHYSIDDGFLPRINFLRSIGMRDSEILKVLTSLTQVLSLSLEENLKPKYMYLVNELNNEVQSLTKYPMYLSLSLDQRIRPRHRFLVSLKKAPEGPFPLSSFVPNDESFCKQWAKTSVDTYLAFRQRLLLKEFAKKYEKTR